VEGWQRSHGWQGSEAGKGSGVGQRLLDILRAQGAHWSERVSRALCALGRQAEEFWGSVFVQASERIPPDRGRGGSWATRLIGHDDKLRDVLREKSVHSAFEDFLIFLRMLEWQLMKCPGSLGFLWEDETRGHVGRMFGGGAFLAAPNPQTAPSPLKL